MILRRVLLAVAAAGAIGSAAGVLVVALAFAVYAFFRDMVGPAGAAAIVAGLTGLGLLLTGLFLALGAGVGRKPQGLGERLADFVREKPLTAIAAGLGAAFLAFRNPAILMAFLAAFLEPKGGKRS